MTDKSKHPMGKGEASISGELVHAPDKLRDMPGGGGNFQAGGVVGVDPLNPLTQPVGLGNTGQIGLPPRQPAGSRAAPATAAVAAIAPEVGNRIASFASGGLIQPQEIGSSAPVIKATPGDTTTRRTPMPKHGTMEKASNFVQHTGPSKQS